MLLAIDSLAVLSFAMVCSALRVLWIGVKRREMLMRGFQTGVMRENATLQGQARKWLMKLSVECIPLGKRVSFGSDDQQALRLLELAGHPLDLDPDLFRGLKAALALVGMVVGMLLTIIGINPMFMVVFALVGFFGPEGWLRRASARRQLKIGTALPDFLDMMSVCLQAGMPQDPALRLVADSFPGPLSEEMHHFCREIEIGVPRVEAYKNLLKRNTCKELEMLIQALIQGAQLGVPIATTFSIQAQDMRITRSNRAKEIAGQASPKITLITTFLVTPAVFLFIIGLLVLNLIYNPDAFGIGGLF